MMTKKIKVQSPLGRLILEKREVKRLCRIQEERLAEDWRFVRNNAGRLLASELIKMFWSRKEGARNELKAGKNGLGGNHELLAVVWQMARPVVVRWAMSAGWRVVRSMFRRRRQED